MATRTIREKPKELLPARLFLEDVSEISNIVKDTYSRALPDAPSPTLKYVLNDNRECETLEDLEKRGGFCKGFDIRIEQNEKLFLGWSAVRIGRTSRIEYPPISTSSELDSALYLAISRVFEDREDKLKSFCLKIPFTVLTAGFYFIYVLTALMEYYAIHRKAIAVVAVTYAVFYGSVAYCTLRDNGVYLSYEEENRASIEHSKRDDRSKLYIALISVTAGAFLKFLFDVLAKHISH